MFVMERVIYHSSELSLSYCMWEEQDTFRFICVGQAGTEDRN